MSAIYEEVKDVTRYIENHKHLTLQDKQKDFENLLAYARPFVHLDSSSKMIEVGTGTGWFPILCKLNGLQCKGLEISQQLVDFALQYAEANGVQGVEFELQNIESADMGENLYDVVWASSVFEHIQDWKLALRKMHRALKPGGILFFESTNKWSFRSGEHPMPFYGWMPDFMRYRFRMLLEGKDIMKLGIDFNQFTYRRLRREFRKVGFSQWHDRVGLAQPDRVQNPTKRMVLQWCKNNALIRELVLTFFEGTTFVCIK